MREWLSRWGVPDIIASDRGSQFVSDLWLEVSSLMGIARDPTTSYHPQHNGKIERMRRSLKNSLHARLLGRVNWLSELLWVIGLRVASNLDNGVSPSILVTGQQSTLPGQALVFSAAEYCSPVWSRSPHVKKVDVAINSSLWSDHNLVVSSRHLCFSSQS